MRTRPPLLSSNHSTPSPRYTLWTGLAVSVCVHAAALAWRFEDAPPPAAVGLEVVLVNAGSLVAPPEPQSPAPQLLAQVASTGGGQAQGENATTPLPYTGPDAPPWMQEDLRQRQAQLEAAQREVLRQWVNENAVPVSHEETLATPHHAADGRDELDQDALIQNPQLAELAARVRAYDRQPRTHFFAPSTSPVHYAQYVDEWRRTVEEIGTRHYPPEARGRVYGRLRMTVLLAADGSVRAIEIDQPSEHALLNQAARRIVQLAAPFAPFPPELARETEQLSITRTWHFVNDQLQTGTP